MLTNVDSNLLSLVMMSVHQDPLNEVVAILVARYVDQRDAGTIRMSGCDDSQIALEKLDTTNLQAFLDNFGGKLIDAVAVGIVKDVINDAALVWW